VQTYEDVRANLLSHCNFIGRDLLGGFVQTYKDVRMNLPSHCNFIGRDLLTFSKL
jgi:hypothetical protein